MPICANISLSACLSGHLPRCADIRNNVEIGLLQMFKGQHAFPINLCSLRTWEWRFPDDGDIN